MCLQSNSHTLGMWFPTHILNIMLYGGVPEKRPVNRPDSTRDDYEINKHALEEAGTGSPSCSNVRTCLCRQRRHKQKKSGESRSRMIQRQEKRRILQRSRMIQRQEKRRILQRSRMIQRQEKRRIVQRSRMIQRQEKRRILQRSRMIQRQEKRRIVQRSRMIQRQEKRRILQRSRMIQRQEKRRILQLRSFHYTVRSYKFLPMRNWAAALFVNRTALRSLSTGWQLMPAV